MVQSRSHRRMASWGLMLGASAIALAAFGTSSGQADDGGTASPIKHIIVLIGENRTFDSVFATYKAKYGQSVGNLLSRGIIKADGSPGANSGDATQYQVNTPLPGQYFISVPVSSKTAYSPFLPAPDLGGAPDQQISPDDSPRIRPAFSRPSTNNSRTRNWRRWSPPSKNRTSSCCAPVPPAPATRADRIPASPTTLLCPIPCSR